MEPKVPNVKLKCSMRRLNLIEVSCNDDVEPARVEDAVNLALQDAGLSFKIGGYSVKDIEGPTKTISFKISRNHGTFMTSKLMKTHLASRLEDIGISSETEEDESYQMDEIKAAVKDIHDPNKRLHGRLSLLDPSLVEDIGK